jgi:anti-sigma factor RsiW
MFVIRLPNGHLLAPESAMDHEGQVVGDAYVEVRPSDPEYARLASRAISEEELDRQRRRWREDDEALRREFEDYLVNGRQDARPPGESPGA